MIRFALVDDTLPIAVWLPSGAGLLAAASVAWLACPVPPVHSLLLSEVFLIALNYGLLVLVACAVMMWSARRFQRRRADWFALWLTSAIASWFAPLSIFLFLRSPAAVITAAVLGVGITLLVRRLSDFSEDDGFHPGEMRLMRRFPSSLCASACLQAGAAGMALGYTSPAALLIATSSAILAWCYTATGLLNRSRYRWTPIALVVIAVLFAATGLTRYLRVARGYGDGNSMFSHQAATGGQADRPGGANEGAAPVTLGETYAGVILWPEIESKTKLVAPIPAMGRGLSLMSRIRPLSIPFYGAYWFFKSPDRYPPKNSLMSRGSPALMKFNTTDHTPIAMEAHQNFGSLISLSCCSRIQLLIRNGDRHAGTVSLELILVNTTIPDKPSLSLGWAPVTSIARGESTTEEILSFSIPPSPPIREFDEATVVFRMGGPRRDISAKVAIEQFLLVPHGVALQ